jgi:hypothetical protein
MSDPSEYDNTELKLLVTLVKEYFGLKNEMDFSSEKIDWSRFIKLVVKHRVVPLIMEQLKTYDLSIPDKTWEALKKVQFDNSLNSLKLTVELIKITELLHQDGIEFIPLKGPAISQDLYGDPTIRMYKDLDLIVRKQDINRTLTALETLGYKAKDPFGDWSTKRKRLFEKSIHHINVFQEEKSIEIELHWRLGISDQLFPITSDQIFSTAVNKEFRGIQMLRMQPDIELLYLFYHAANHRWFRLGWLIDLLALTQQMSSKRAFLKKSKEFKLFNHVNHSLYLIQTIFNVQTFKSQIEYEKINDRVIANFMNHLPQEAYLMSWGQGNGIKMLWDKLLLTQDLSFLSKIKFTLQYALLNYRIIAKYKLPNGLIWLYYLGNIFPKFKR